MDALIVYHSRTVDDGHAMRSIGKDVVDDLAIRLTRRGRSTLNLTAITLRIPLVHHDAVQGIDGWRSWLDPRPLRASDICRRRQKVWTAAQSGC